MPSLTDEQRIKLLTKKIKALFEEIKVIRDDAKEAERDSSNFPKFRGKYKELESLYNAFNKAWDTLLELYIVLDKEKDFPFDEKSHKALVRTYVYECNTVFETRMNPVPTPGVPRQSLNTALFETGEPSLNTSGRNRLSKIKIPPFHGDILKWPQFRDIFLSMVHDDDSVTLIEKFHYLVGALSGEPLQIVSAFPVSAANYASAWDALNKRFNNKRVLASAYLQRIRSFKPSAQQFDNLTHLRSFLNAVGESFSALRSLEIANEADFFKLYLALECLDSETRKLYEDKQQGQEFPTYDSLIEFVQHRCQILELSATSINSKAFTSKASDVTSRRSKVLATVESRASVNGVATHDQPRYSCPKCEGDHLLFRCLIFQGMSPSERMDFAKTQHLCFNCLKAGHFPIKCPSKYQCSICRRRHHSLLHQSQNTTIKNITSASTSPPKNTPSQPSTSTVVATDTSSPGLVGATAGCKTVLLGTAVVNMRNWKGSLCPVRIVIDSGSQFSIITTDCAKRLGLTWSPTKRMISGVGCIQPPPAKGTLFCRLSPINQDGLEVHTTALVMSSIIPSMPSISLSPEISKLFNSVNLADDIFWESRPIDFLLGSDLFLQILLSEPTHKVTDNFGTLATIFGQVVIGVPPSNDELDKAVSCLAITDTPLSDEILKSFWLIEEALPAEHLHPDDAACETHFRNNVSRLPSGRYMVALPFCKPNLSFPSSKYLSMKRFRNLEAKLDKDDALKLKYTDFIDEYINLGHMELTSEESAYIIPHHAVFKRELGAEDGSKLRVVFDASMKTVNGSLNDSLYVGPKLQQDISAIILNFRAHRLAFSTDIVKMFRQILIRPEDRRYQHILWRFSHEEPVRTYALNTVTYGLTSSPYLALRVLRQLAEDDGNKYPEAAKVLMNDVYVDDVITGADSLDKALVLKKQLTSLLHGGGFEAHKWASNSPEFLGHLSSDVMPSVGLLPKDATTKVLGMLWNAASDYFYFQVELTPSAITKRSMLSVIARLFDPLGFLAPIVFYAKNILQRLWLLKIDWDDQPPHDIIQIWNEFLSELLLVKDVQLPRYLRLADGTPMILGFCDASQRGYAAVLYLRILEEDSTIHSFLIKAKTRLSPVKTMSIPRLELCAAHLLVKLLRSVEDFCKIHDIADILLFSDSTVVLSWLRMSPTELKTFVANRVGYILSHTQIHQWHHVPTAENPADLASRGALTSSLLKNRLWWKGPPWINANPLILPPPPNVLSDVPERKSTVALVTTTIEEDSLHSIVLTKFSGYRKVIATVAYVLRFIHNSRSPHNKRLNALAVEELQEATNYLIRQAQRQYFSTDFDFSCKGCLSSRFKALAVFLDGSGLLRVGGRLTHAQLPYDQRHPIILPPQAPFTALLVDYTHKKNFHLGLSALQAYLQRTYYIFQIRSFLRKRIWMCQRCFKARAKPSNPLMADLPLSRVSQGRPFIRVGIDFAGPFSIKVTSRRNSPIAKAYLCLFVCMAVKAVHLELVSALSTDAFLAAFDRFIARRGLPTDIYSDCGTNFVGAARHLKELHAWFLSQPTEQQITTHSAQLGIKWHFNPPYTPHFGGLWEAAVKTAKSYLRKTLGDRPFNFEELATIFARIEAVMNSRPLCTTSAQPDSFDYLTPGHFLIGSALLAPPERDLSHVNISRQSRWQLIQSSVQVFWKRWVNEYIHLLQSRPKWTKRTSPLKIDDLVLIQDSQTSPLNWKLGRVVELHPGPDGIVRVVTIKTPTGTLKRPAHKLAPLPLCDQDN